jgi:hypothetical protein
VTLTVRYALTRAELWAWYKVTWLRRLWVYHLAVVVLVLACFSLLRVGGSNVSGLLLGMAYSALLIALMVAWPQLRYRSDERTLTFDADGLSYVRGRQSGRMPWTKIGSVADAHGGIVVTGRSQSAFIVPDRAFGDEAEKARAFRTISDLYRLAL